MLLRMQAELIYFALSVAAGVLAALSAGGIKRLHRGRRLSLWLGIVDLLYWFLLGFSLFLLCFYRNSGIFRGYAAAGTLLGCGLSQSVGRRISRRAERHRSEHLRKKGIAQKGKKD